jgi:transcriptional regulator
MPSGRLRFHLANGNALARHLDGLTVVASVGGPGSYVSPNWYAEPAAHVPTWNYRAVEIEGVVTALDHAELRALLDLSAATFEPRVRQDWTMAKLDPGRRDAMLRAITGFELTPTAIRSTDKASQNRSEADARGVVAGMEAIGDAAGAAAIRRVRGW